MATVISLAQFDVERGNPEANLELLAKYAGGASNAGAALLCAPEMCTTGFDWERNRELAATANETIVKVAGIARSNSVALCCSLLEATADNAIANTLFYFDREGELVGKYRKSHLFSLFREDRHLAAGNSAVVLETGLGRAGCGICYDLRFPEIFRACVDAGAVFQLLPSAFPHPRLEHWRTLVRARAIENQFFMIAVNQCGTEGKEGSAARIRYFGHSMVVDPWGEVLAEAGESPELVTVEIDLAMVAEVRAKLPALQDRRPELYRRPVGDS